MQIFCKLLIIGFWAFEGKSQCLKALISLWELVQSSIQAQLLIYILLKLCTFGCTAEKRYSSLLFLCGTVPKSALHSASVPCLLTSPSVHLIQLNKVLIRYWCMPAAHIKADIKNQLFSLVWIVQQLPEWLDIIFIMIY